jgi:cleavage and polyadenylation specificity factor subunit 1
MPESEKKVGEIEDATLKPGMYEPTFEKYQLELVSPVTWETVDVFQLLDGEQILCIQAVDLISTETKTGRKQYIAVGTAFMRSEELACRGRVLLFEIIEVVPEPENPQTNHKFKLFCKTDEKSPVSALCDVNGCLLAAIGTKIIMYSMEEGELNGIAFLDVNIYVISISAVKNLILISDVFKSVWFVVFQEDPPKMVALAKDHYPVQVYGADFIVDDNSLSMIVSDAQKNLHVLSYAPYAVQSQGGQRLIRRGEMHAGLHIHSFNKLRCRPNLHQDEWVPSKQYVTIGGTLSGGLVLIQPISEKMFKRLYSLYSRMVTHLEHACGLNPRGYRHIGSSKTIAVSSVVSGPPGIFF